MNIYLTDSDEEGKRLASSCHLSVKVCKTWFESQRTHYETLTQSKFGKALKKDRKAELDLRQI